MAKLQVPSLSFNLIALNMSSSIVWLSTSADLVRKSEKAIQCDLGIARASKDTDDLDQADAIKEALLKHQLITKLELAKDYMENSDLDLMQCEPMRTASELMGATIDNNGKEHIHDLQVAHIYKSQTVRERHPSSVGFPEAYGARQDRVEIQIVEFALPSIQTGRSSSGP